MLTLSLPKYIPNLLTAIFQSFSRLNPQAEGFCCLLLNQLSTSRLSKRQTPPTFIPEIFLLCSQLYIVWRRNFRYLANSSTSINLAIAFSLLSSFLYFRGQKPPRRWLGGWVWPLKYFAKQGTLGFSLGGAPFAFIHTDTHTSQKEINI